MSPSPGETWKDLSAWLGKGGSAVLFWPFLLGYSFQIAHVDKGSILSDPLLYTRTLQKGISLLDPDIVSVWDDASPLLEVIRGKYGKDRAVPLGRSDWGAVDSGWVRKDVSLQSVREGLHVLVTLLGDRTPIFVPVPGPLAIGNLLGGEGFEEAIREGDEEAFELLGAGVFLANDLIRQTMEIGVRGILLADGNPVGWCANARERGREEYETLRNTVDYFNGTLMLRTNPDVKREEVFQGIYHGIVPTSASAPTGADRSAGSYLPEAVTLPAEIWKSERSEEMAAGILTRLRQETESGGGHLITSFIPAGSDPERVLKVRRLIRNVFP